MFAKILLIVLGLFIGLTMILSPVQPWVDHETHLLVDLVGACFLAIALLMAIWIFCDYKKEKLT